MADQFYPEKVELFFGDEDGVWSAIHNPASSASIPREEMLVSIKDYDLLLADRNRLKEALEEAEADLESAHYAHYEAMEREHDVFG
jgi:hypothetical protein